MQQVQLSIPSPCHENWETMQPVEKGRFCNACAKQVVDFSTMSDAQVLNYLSAVKNESVCGRAYPEQLNRVMEAPKEVKRKKWYWNYIALFLLFFSRSSESKAQKGKVALPVPTQQPQNIREVGEIAYTEPSRAVSGKVLDAGGNPVPFATISISGTDRRYTSGKDGGFVFLVTDREKSLTITAPGFKSRNIAVSSSAANYVVRLETARELKGKVVTAGMMIVKPGKH